MLKQRINVAALIIFLIFTGFLTVISFIGAFAYEEGTMSSSIFVPLFKIFRFPTHTLFWKFFNQTKATFDAGLLINIIFFAFLAERVFSFIKRPK